MKTGAFANTKDEADAAFSANGKPEVHATEDQVFYFITDEPMDETTDYLMTVRVDGREYAVTGPHEGRGADKTIMYFSIANGKQVDFVDRVKVEDPETAKCDLSDYTGPVVFSLYQTDPQVEGTYPTGRILIKRKTLPIANA